MKPTDHRRFTGLAGHTRPDVRKAGLTALKVPGTTETLRNLRDRRDREGTQRHAGHAELRGSAGSTMKEYGGRSTRMDRGPTLLT
jgi:hypothetical protein